MHHRETYRDTLRYALAIAGSEEELAGHLRVTRRLLQNWLSGLDPIPEEVFHSALDLVICSNRQAIVRSRERLQRIAR